MELPSSWTRSFKEFHCPTCGNTQAYRSRSRGLIEKALLPVLMHKPVRCERCFHRSYIFCTIPVPLRATRAAKAAAGSESTSGSGARVA